MVEAGLPDLAVVLSRGGSGRSWAERGEADVGVHSEASSRVIGVVQATSLLRPWRVLVSCA